MSQECYRRNVAKIVPLLQSELLHAKKKLEATDNELHALSIERLKQSANAYRELFAKALSEIIQGSAKASPEVFLLLFPLIAPVILTRSTIYLGVGRDASR